MAVHSESISIVTNSCLVSHKIWDNSCYCIIENGHLIFMIVSLKTDIYLFRSVSVSDETPLGKITIQFRQEEVDK